LKQKQNENKILNTVENLELSQSEIRNNKSAEVQHSNIEVKNQRKSNINQPQKGNNFI